MMCAEPGMMPIRKPITEPRAIGQPDSRHSCAVRPQLAQLRADHLAGDLMARRRQDFAEPEQPDRDRHDADAVAELGDVERVAEVAGHHVDADGAEQQAERRHQQRARQRGGRHVGEEDEAEHEQRGIFGRAEAQREVWRAAARSGSARSRRRCRRSTSRPPRCKARRPRGPSSRKKYLLTAAQMARFVTDGYLMVENLVPEQLNEAVYRDEKSGIPGQLFWKKSENIRAVFELPQVKGIIQGLVGLNPVLRPLLPARGPGWQDQGPELARRFNY